MMKGKVKAAIGIAALAAVIAGAAIAYGILSENYEDDKVKTSAESAAGTERPKVEAPDFVVYDETGAEVRLSVHEGKPVVLNFWATWCGPCRSELSDFNEVYAELGEEIEFMMVNLAEPSGDDPAKVERFSAENGYTFPVYYDSDGHAASVYGVRAVPTTVFIDAEGMVTGIYQSAMSGDMLRGFIDELL